jgi:uroporphyrinogen decarboxylase
MTSKERVLAALDFQKPDRVPRFDSFWSEFLEQWQKAKGLGESADIKGYYGIDISICVANEGTFPGSAAELERGSDYVISRDAWGCVVRTVPGGAFYEQLEVPIKEKSDLDRVTFEPADLDDRYTDFVQAVARESRERCVFCKTGGPYLRTSFVRGTTQFLIDIASDEPFAQELALRMTDHLIGVGLESLRRSNLYDTGLWIYDDIAHNAAPMMSPDKFERIFYPQVKRMVQAFKAAGARKVCFHSDGNILPVLDMLIDAGVDGINPVEPKAGMDLARLHHQYEGRLALIGGMCNAFVLPGPSTSRIEEETRRILEVGRDGGVVIGAHSVGPDVSVENYDLYHTVLETHGG